MFKQNICLIALTIFLFAEINAQNVTTVAPTTRMPCPRRCPPMGPALCGRNPDGFCRRFGNQCTMNRLNCRLEPNNRWTTAPADSCAVGGSPREIRRCLAPCPIMPPPCAPQPNVLPICVTDRSRRLCRLVANNCEWDRANCEAPRGVWAQGRQSQCRDMEVGARPAACRFR